MIPKTTHLSAQRAQPTGSGHCTLTECMGAQLSTSTCAPNLGFNKLCTSERAKREVLSSKRCDFRDAVIRGDCMKLNFPTLRSCDIHGSNTHEGIDLIGVCARHNNLNLRGQSSDITSCIASVLTLASPAAPCGWSPAGTSFVSFRLSYVLEVVYMR